MREFNLNMYEAFDKLDYLRESICRTEYGDKAWYFNSNSQIKDFIVNNVNGFTGIRVLAGEDDEGTIWFLVADAHKLEHEMMREAVIDEIGKLAVCGVYCIGYPDAAAFNDANFELGDFDSNNNFIHDSDFFGRMTTITTEEYKQVIKENKAGLHFEVIFKYPTFSVVGTNITSDDPAKGYTRGLTLEAATTLYKNSALGKALGLPQEILVQMTDDNLATYPDW